MRLDKSVMHSAAWHNPECSDSWAFVEFFCQCLYLTLEEQSIGCTGHRSTCGTYAVSDGATLHYGAEDAHLPSQTTRASLLDFSFVLVQPIDEGFVYTVISSKIVGLHGSCQLTSAENRRCTIAHGYRFSLYGIQCTIPSRHHH